MSTLSLPAPVAKPDRPNNWGRWGDDDQRGALNVLTAEHVKDAAASITAGAVYSLGIPVQNHDVPKYDYRGAPMRLTLQDGTDDGTVPPEMGCHVGTGAHEDVVVMASHNATHMDALIHVFGEYSHYNGVEIGAMQAMAGATKLGIEKVGGVAARAVIFDMVDYYGEAEEWVNPGHAISSNDLQGAAAKQGVDFREGNIALIRTGYLQYWMANRPGPSDYNQPGINTEAAAWLASLDAPVIGSDNSAVEVIPFDNNDFLSVHKVLLVDHGIYLLEFLDLSGPVHDGNYEGLLALGPLKVTGATGSPINPIFIA